jgi:hypothetical protein
MRAAYATMSIDIFRVTQHTLPACHVRDYPGSTAKAQEDVLTLHVKQYTPLDQGESVPSDAITLIAAHACGYPKVCIAPSDNRKRGNRALCPGQARISVGHRRKKYIF